MTLTSFMLWKYLIWLTVSPTRAWRATIFVSAFSMSVCAAESMCSSAWILHTSYITWHPSAQLHIKIMIRGQIVMHIQVILCVICLCLFFSTAVNDVKLVKILQQILWRDSVNSAANQQYNKEMVHHRLCSSAPCTKNSSWHPPITACYWLHLVLDHRWWWHTINSRGVTVCKMLQWYCCQCFSCDMPQ